MTILVAAIVGILGVVLFLRHETEVPPKAIQVDKGAATTAVKMTQPNSAPFETEESPAVPARPTEERYPNAKSLDLIRPSPSNQDQYLRILAGQVLGLDLPQEMTAKEGYPEIRMQPVEAQKLLEDLAALPRAGFTIPGVVRGIRRGFDSGGFARFYIYLEAGGSIFRGSPTEPGVGYSVVNYTRCVIERGSNLGCSTGAAAQAVFTLVRLKASRWSAWPCGLRLEKW